MHDIGRIEAVTGGMFSGKTEELIRRMRRVQLAQRPFQIFKPIQDDRYSSDAIVTHTGDQMPSTSVHDISDLLNCIQPDTKVIGIDEVQFFGDAIVGVIQDLAQRGCRVIVTGLDKDYLGRPFGPMPQILAIAEDVTKLKAVCRVCGEDAYFSQRMVKADGLVVVGGKDAYQARCRRHFEP